MGAHCSYQLIMSFEQTLVSRAIRQYVSKEIGGADVRQIRFYQASSKAINRSEAQ